MKQFLTKNKTTLVGLLTILWAFASGIIVEKAILTPEQAATITSVLIAFGLIAAKDSNKHSTTQEVKQADKEKLEDGSSV